MNNFFPNNTTNKIHNKLAKGNQSNNTNGILLLDKPAGITSFKCVEIIRRQLKVKKVGHAGTLDPFATGLLILLVGKTTKLQQEFMQMDKCYKASIAFGSETNTLDPTGEVIRTSDTRVTSKAIEHAITEHFIGKVQQVPPNFSAVKIAGKRAYHLSRKGEEVELPPKTVHIRNFQLLNFSEETQTALVELTVSSGTYVRSIARDLGISLGSVAHVSSLQRTSIGSLKLTEATALNYTPAEISPLYPDTSKSGLQLTQKPLLESTNKTDLQLVVDREKTQQQTTPAKLLNITECLPCTTQVMSESDKKKLWAAKQVGNFNVFSTLFRAHPYLVLCNSKSATTTKTIEDVAVLKLNENTCRLIYYNAGALNG